MTYAFGTICVFLVMIIGAVLCTIGFSQGNNLVIALGATDMVISIVASMALDSMYRKEAVNG